MSNEIQLIVNGVLLPTTTRDRYSCYPDELKEQITMISGRMVEEVRGTVQKISYSYDYMGNDLMRRLLTALRSRSDLSVQFLDPLSDSMQSASFRCTKQPTPQFAFSRDGVGLWNNIAFTLEEVEGS